MGVAEAEIEALETPVSCLRIRLSIHVYIW
jgi:hypothetical protein